MRMLVAPTVAPRDDDALAAAARNGDHAAYTELYEQYAGRVYARLTQLVGPTADREDLLQQVFFELYRALPRFRAESSISTFIHGIAVHVALDHLRRRRRKPQDFAAVDFDELIDGSATPEERAARRDELGRILVLLERVKPRKRIAFALVAIAGLSLDEAAALLDARVDVVKQRVLRARRELLAMLARAERAEGIA
ncbi:MAG TPA: RNA polymerase sigma factor [Kofleriaceae bacterium]|nr:RNA polymerase sigma factor [Kofleriaceae bacterium]